MEEFHCGVVGESVDLEICQARIKQAGEMKDKGEEHFSLFKCFDCTNPDRERIEAQPPEPAVKHKKDLPVEPSLDDKNQPICRVCLRPANVIKNQFLLRRQMHANCYSKAKRDGTLPPESLNIEELIARSKPERSFT